jgi:hypothetical protein
MEWVECLFLIHKAQGANLGLETGYPDQGFIIVFLAPFWQMPVYNDTIYSSWPLPSTCFKIHYSLIILPFSGMYSKLLTASLSRLLLLWLYGPLLGIGHFFSFLTLYTVSRTPWMGDQPVARPLHTHRATQTQNKLTHYRHPSLE